ncbi:MAG: GNAT family N-acetyltransferase, partial [Saprospiraceae bacterium]
AKSKGYFRIELTSRPTRWEANRLYKRLGFELRETNVYMKDLN